MPMDLAGPRVWQLYGGQGKGFLTGQGSSGGRDYQADGSRRQLGTGQAPVCQAVGQSEDGSEGHGVVRKGAAGRAIGPGRG